MRRIFIAAFLLALSAPAAAAPSLYCTLHSIPPGGPVEIVTGTLKPRIVARVAGTVISNSDVFDSLLLREDLDDIEHDSKVLAGVEAEEQARLVAQAQWLKDARLKHVAVTPSEVDSRLAELARASGNTIGGLKARLQDAGGAFALLRSKIAAAIAHAKATGRPFSFPYRISPPPPCPIRPLPAYVTRPH